LAHGAFEARMAKGKIPKCPKGCDPTMVELVYNQAPAHVSGRTRTADRLLKEAASMQGLSDISTSPSRPGGSVAERNRMRNGGMAGPQGREYPTYAKTISGNLGELLPTMGHKANELRGEGMQTMMKGFGYQETGLGHEYQPGEWKKGDDGKVRHENVAPPIRSRPVGTTGTSVDRVKDEP
jgi:hypothetical protein